MTTLVNTYFDDLLGSCRRWKLRPRASSRNRGTPEFLDLDGRCPGPPAGTARTGVSRRRVCSAGSERSSRPRHGNSLRPATGIDMAQQLLAPGESLLIADLLIDGPGDRDLVPRPIRVPREIGLGQEKS